MASFFTIITRSHEDRRMILERPRNYIKDRLGQVDEVVGELKVLQSHSGQRFRM